MLYYSWDMVHDRCNCYFSLWVIFCPFTPVTAQKMKISKKQKKDSRYHHFTQVYQNDDHMLYCSWDMACDWCNYCFFILGYFLPVYPITAQKIKSLKNKKNSWRYHFTQVYQKSWLYAILFLKYGTWQM